MMDGWMREKDEQGMGMDGLALTLLYSGEGGRPARESGADMKEHVRLEGDRAPTCWISPVRSPLQVCFYRHLINAAASTHSLCPGITEVRRNLGPRIP